MHQNRPINRPPRRNSVCPATGKPDVDRRPEAVGGELSPSLVTAHKTKGTQTVPPGQRHNPIFPSNQLAPMYANTLSKLFLLCTICQAWLSDPGCVHAVLQTQTEPASLINMSISYQN